MHRKRVVSLVPSSTETLLALGADVVACTRFCEQPDIAHVGGTKNPDVGSIVALGPDLVVLDREENRIEDHDELVAAGLDVFVTDVTSLASALDAVAGLAGASGLEPPPDIGVGERPGPTTDRRRALVPIWRRPWMAIGAATYGGSLLEYLGIDVVPESGGPYPEIEFGGASIGDVDLVLVPSEPYVFTDAHLLELRAALPAADIRRVDGQDLFWWGIRTPAAVTRLATLID